jgi:hypothetical protein
MKLIVLTDTKLVSSGGMSVSLTQGQKLRIAERQDEPCPEDLERETVWVHNPLTNTRIEVPTRIFTPQSLREAGMQ